MNLEEESHLSAYLDDELDPADRLAVEWSVEASPPRADQLRSIALVRDAVAGLDRPAIPRDLAPALVARLASNRSRARPRSTARPARIALALSSFTGLSAIAASLIFALIRLNQSLHETPERPIVVAQVEPVPAPRTHPTELFAPDPISAPPSASLVPVAIDSTSKLVAATPSGPESIGPPDLPAAPGEAAERADRRLIGGMLARSHVRRILIVTDVIDASDQVRTLIAENGRETPEFGRISIRQEIVIDPDHAEAAEVFAVPIDERGRRSFVDRLQQSFPNLVEEGQSSPELVTQLTEVGHVAILRGLEVAPLGDPPGDIPAFIAHRERERVPFIFEADRARNAPNRAEKPGLLASKRPEPTQADGENGPDFVGPPDLYRKPSPKPGDRVTLLVWVTRPSRL